MDDDSEKKRTEVIKKCVIKRENKFNDSNIETILKSQQRLKSEKHNLYTE